MHFVLALCLVAVGTALCAQDWALRTGDRLLDAGQVRTLTEGRTLEFHDRGRSKYSHGGAYSYTYASGLSAFGRYRVEADGTVCVTYRNGAGRCDRYVQNGGQIVLLTERGERFPVRNGTGKE
jgi:hypothetical protein